MKHTYTVTDLDIEAFLDNELSEKSAECVRIHLEKDDAAKARYDYLVHQKTLLCALYRNA